MSDPETRRTAAGAPEEAARQLDWFRRARGGDWEAFEALVDSLQGRVFGLALRMLGQRQDAEDVTQQTFLSVLEHLEDFREEAGVATWVLRIATNHALKALRRRRTFTTEGAREGKKEDGYASLPHPEFIARWQDNPRALAERAEVRALIEKALGEVDEKYRVVFVLRDIEGLSTRETAEALGLTEANVKVRLLRARLQLRERLTAALGDEATRVYPDHAHE